jgi:hypothetical protein
LLVSRLEAASNGNDASNCQMSQCNLQLALVTCGGVGKATVMVISEPLFSCEILEIGPWLGFPTL